jgi:hypothetical protein
MNIIVGKRQLRTMNVAANIGQRTLPIRTDADFPKLMRLEEKDWQGLKRMFIDSGVITGTGELNVKVLSHITKGKGDRWTAFRTGLEAWGFKARAPLTDPTEVRKAIIGRLAGPDVLEPKWGRDQSLVEMTLRAVLEGDSHQMNVAMSTIGRNKIKVFNVDLSGMDVKNVITIVHRDVSPPEIKEKIYEETILRICTSEMIFAITSQRIFFVPFSRESNLFRESMAAGILKALNNLRPDSAKAVIAKMTPEFADGVRTAMKQRQ